MTGVGIWVFLWWIDIGLYPLVFNAQANCILCFSYFFLDMDFLDYSSHIIWKTWMDGWMDGVGFSGQQLRLFGFCHLVVYFIFPEEDMISFRLLTRDFFSSFHYQGLLHIYEVMNLF